MWNSPESVHVYRGRGYPHLCNRCFTQLEEGQAYRRRVWRPHRKQELVVMVEHDDERDCPWEEFELMMVGEPVEVEVAVGIKMVISSRMVAKVAINGETVFQSIPYIETITAAIEDDELQDQSDDGSDDDIPF